MANKMVMMTDGGKSQAKPNYRVIGPNVVQVPKPKTQTNPNYRVIGPNVVEIPTQSKTNDRTSTYVPPSSPSVPNIPGAPKPKVTGVVPTTSNSVTNPVQPVSPPAQPEVTFQDMIEQMNEARRKSQIALLDKARDEAIRNLEAQQGELAPRYYDARNEAASASDIGAMNFAQYMASRGVKGGAGGMPEIYRNAALQTQIGALNQQEQSMIDAIASNKTGVLNAYEQDVVSTNADIEAQKLQAMIEQMNADRSFGLQEANVTGTYQGSPTLQKQMFQADMDFRNKQLAIDQAYKNGQLSLQRAAAARAANNAAYQRQKDKLNEDFKREQWEYQKQQDHLNRLDSQGLMERTIGPNVVTVPKSKPSQPVDLSGYMEKAIGMVDSGSSSSAQAYIRSLPVSSDDKAKIANYLGLPR